MKSKISRFITLFKDRTESIIFESNLIKFKNVEIETLATFKKKISKCSPIVLCQGLPYSEDEVFEKGHLHNLKYEILLR